MKVEKQRELSILIGSMKENRLHAEQVIFGLQPNSPLEPHVKRYWSCVCVVWGFLFCCYFRESHKQALPMVVSVSTKSKNTRKANSCKHDKLDCTYLMQPLFLVQTYFQMVGSSFDWHSFPQKQTTKTIQKTLENEIREVEIFKF